MYVCINVCMYLHMQSDKKKYTLYNLTNYCECLVLRPEVTRVTEHFASSHLINDHEPFNITSPLPAYGPP